MISEAIDRGTIDFGIVFGNVDFSKYDFLPIPYEDTWGVLMRRDAPLSQKDFITAEDLMGKPLIISRQAFQNLEFKNFFSCEQEQLNIAATYSLLFNGSLMVDEGQHEYHLEKIPDIFKTRPEVFAEIAGNGVLLIWFLSCFFRMSILGDD